eukprot:SAG31_NODE_136_length_23089_cov_8.825924_1_plen_82_part_00
MIYLRHPLRLPTQTEKSGESVAPQRPVRTPSSSNLEKTGLNGRELSSQLKRIIIAIRAARPAVADAAAGGGERVDGRTIII